MNRREALQRLGIVGAAGLAAAEGMALFRPPGPGHAADDVELELTAAPGEVAILPGAATRVWQFSGRVIRGPSDSLTPVAASYLGPTIRLRRGQHVRIRFLNRLEEPSILHWHGLDVPEASDGHPRLVVPPGGEYLYDFTVTNRAGTYWYHPHPHQRTGAQVYRGLAGMLLVTDEEEAALNLPRGAEELTLVLQDRTFDGGNQLQYLGPGMMERMQGFLGDRMLVSGRLAPEFPVTSRAHRVRLLNGSSARIYRLAWGDGTPFTVLGGDGGLLESPVTRTVLTLAPAQRADLLVDLAGRSVGDQLTLEATAYPATDAGPAMGMRATPNGTAQRLATLRIARQITAPFRLPARLTAFAPAWTAPPTLPPRRVTLDFRQMQWFLGGRSFEMLATTPEEQVAAGASQVWELANVGGMMGMPMAHPIHLHGPQFRILERRGGPASSAGSLREGIVDEGWRDTVLVLPGEIVRIQAHFTAHRGLYLYHCHILEHEDGGMMRNFRVA